MDFTEMIQTRVPADYDWDSPGIIRLGSNNDIAAYAIGNFGGRSLIFCHGNGETAVSEKYWFDRLSYYGISVICPDYRGYALSKGSFSEDGCYEVAYAAYDYLVREKGGRCEDVFVLGYSLGSAVAIELASNRPVAGLILEAPFLSGRELKRFWSGGETPSEDDEEENRFPVSSKLSSIRTPTLVIHGTSDDVVPFSQGEAVFKRLASMNKTFIPVRGAGHCDFKMRLGERYFFILQNFFSQSSTPPDRWATIDG